MQDFYFLSNNLFTTYTLEEEFPKLYDFNQDLTPIFSQIKALYDISKFSSQNEHQFEDGFISKVLEILGWHTIRQEEKMIQGKIEKPDFLLFTSLKDKESYEKIPKSSRFASNEYISVILESKAYDVAIDNKKVKDNPHFQILRYLSNLKLNFGFLTNGRFWRLYDNSKLSSQKIFYEINLEAIIQNDDIEAFKYFYFIFNAQNFIPIKTKPQPIQALFTQNANAKTKIEDDLKSLIYGIDGKDSVFEIIGKTIYAKHSDKPLDDIYQNTLYFVFRLLFIAYFEDKFESILKRHSCYNDEFSISILLKNLTPDSQNYSGFGRLSNLFRVFDKGDPNFDMPIFNGGLFDSSNAPLLETPKLFDNKTLHSILKDLFFVKIQTKTFKRDYKTLSITHLGTIYEGLLSYFFEVAQEDTHYLLYNDGKSKSIEGYFDAFDYERIAKKHKIVKNTFYPKGELYLKNTSNSRKSSASFYTPTSLTSYLADHALDITDENVLDYKILDNACGSGHFLVQALNTVTEHIITHFDDFENFKNFYEREKASIQANTALYIADYEVDESDVIKRLLLKRMIYGVDLNPFSIELAKLSLWIDSFIFGTPLSFIEHHIKCGNALVGSSIQEFETFYKEGTKNLFYQDFLEQFQALTQTLPKLNALKDTTEEEIKESKTIYAQEIAPKLSTLSLALDFLTAQSFLDKGQKSKIKGREMDYIEGIISNNEVFNDFSSTIGGLSQKYRFFHYEIAFPEVFSSEKKGFDCIIGNPPWDKSEFSDNDFFPQFVSNYRTKKNSEKKTLKLDILAKPHIKTLYEEGKVRIEALNTYYKAYYSLNRVGKDINLFRLFVERNLSLLSPNASLNYVLPSALMYEEGSLALRTYILEKKTLEYFYSFENRKKIFPNVDSRYKFALIQIRNALPPKDHSIKTKFYLVETDSLSDSTLESHFTLEQIKEISPFRLALPEIEGLRPLQILRNLHKTFPHLDFEWLDFRQELNMTSDKDLFLEENQDDLIYLYKGEMIHQNNAEFASPTYFLKPQALEKRLEGKEIYWLRQDMGMSIKGFDFFCSSNSLDPSNLVVFEKDFIRLGYREIARDTDERTLISSLMPLGHTANHKVWLSIPKSYKLIEDEITIQKVEIDKILFVLGIFNSIVVDFIIRSMVTTTISKFFFRELPIPQPSSEEIRSNHLYITIIRNALALQRYNDKSGFFKELDSLFDSKEWVQIGKYQGAYGFGGEPLSVPETEKAYFILKATNDILIAKLYGLDKEDFITILSTFKVLAKKQPYYIELLKSLWDSVEMG